MLVIARKINEQVRIGEDITIRILGVVGNTVRLGIDAPRDVPVYREELWEAIKAENQAAVKKAPEKLPSLKRN